MSQNINYYKGLTLSKEELEYKDYSDKYMSLYVDLIKAGTDDVIFLKNTTDFSMSKVTTTINQLRILEGFCLFNKIAETVPDYEYKRTMDAENFPNQKFFVKSDEKLVTVDDAPGLPYTKYVYLKNYLTPCAFKCTVASDGVLTLLDGGSISKSEVVSVLRNSASGAPTRVRFVGLDFSATGINNSSVYEVNSYTSDVVVLNGTIVAESGEVLCIPIGSFDLGVDNNMFNRSLFSNLETKVVLDTDSTLDETDGVIKLGYLTYTTLSDFTITDLRNDSKYIIVIDTEIDLSDFVTKSTVQTIESEKYFSGIVQNKLAYLNYSSNYSGGYIDINTSGGANEYIFDFQGNAGNLTILGFSHGLKPFGYTPGTNIIPGMSIKVRFKNVGSLTKFSNSTFGLVNNLPIREGILYTIRYDGEEDLSGGTFEPVPVFSLSSTFTEQDGILIQNQVTSNTSNIASLQSIVNGVAFSLNTKIYDGPLGKVFLSYIKQGTSYLVTISAHISVDVNDICATLSSILIPTYVQRTPNYSDTVGETQMIQVADDGEVTLINTSLYQTANVNLTYITPEV